MPRARSNSIVSVWVVPLSTLPTDRMTPVSKRMRSVRVVLPASTCARIPRLIIAMRHAFVEDALDCWTLQRLPHWTLLRNGTILVPELPGRLRTESGCLSEAGYHFIRPKYGPYSHSMVAGGFEVMS